MVEVSLLVCLEELRARLEVIWSDTYRAERFFSEI